MTKLQHKHETNQISFGIACMMFGSMLGYFLCLWMNSVEMTMTSTWTPSRPLDIDDSNLRTSSSGGQRRLFEYDDPKTVEPKISVAYTNTVTGDVDATYIDNQMIGGREVHVGTMCRCPSGALEVPGEWSEVGFDTNIVQPPSKATGPTAKHFVMHPPAIEHGGCTCLKNHKAAEPTDDANIGPLVRYCPDDIIQHPKRFEWDAMPELAIEQRLPLFMGVLSYESPLSLNATLHNWGGHRFFDRMNAAGVFIQLNHMSELDEQIVNAHNELLREDGQPIITPLGSKEQNLHPGLAIGKFCRAAEEHPAGHPNGENLLLFVEKDWHLHSNGPRGKLAKLDEMFSSINALVQRGVHYIRLTPPRPKTGFREGWKCPAMGFPWVCTPAHQHHWTNLPSVIDCKWFLRYMEPYALLDDPIMYGCRPGMQENRYCDWEFALQDGRVPWTESQWVVAHMAPPKMKLFDHHEVDQ